MKRKWNHGEVVGFEVNQLPLNAKKLEVKNDYYVVGESKTYGNDHRVAVKDGCSMYEVNGTLFLKNDVDTKIYCHKEGRHDTEVIPPSIWKIGIRKEYDYLTQEIRNVQD